MGEYLLSLVQKEEYHVTASNLIIVVLTITDGRIICGDPYFIGNFDKAKEATKKSAINKLEILNKNKLNQVNSERDYIYLPAHIRFLRSIMSGDKFLSLVQTEKDLLGIKYKSLSSFNNILSKRINGGK